MVVDSCTDKRTKQVVPLMYLEQLSVDVSRQVRLIVASHWDDDHVRGLDKMYDSAERAEVAFSEALMSEEFFTLLQAEQRTLTKSRTVKTMDSVLRILDARRSSTTGLPEPKLAKAYTPLWTRLPAKGQPACSVVALSPSNTSVIDALAQIGSSIQKAHKIKRRTRITRNRATVALWITVGDSHVLLGGDLETTGNPATGWTAILNSPLRPPHRASVFKVPHHGSVDSYEARVWGEMLTERASAILAPHVKGDNALPTTEGRMLICGHTDLAYITAPPAHPAARTRHGALGKMVDQTVRTIREAEGLPGQTRLRQPITATDDWRVEHFFPSTVLC